MILRHARMRAHYAAQRDAPHGRAAPVYPWHPSCPLPRLRPADADCVREMAQQVVLEIGDAGRAVIVGRGSAYYLANREDVFHVFVYASRREKVRRLQAAGKSERESLELAETVDRDRAAFIRRYFSVEWPSRHLFHLMVNSRVGDEAAVETITRRPVYFR